jgi:hypothetical protein
MAATNTGHHHIEISFTRVTETDLRGWRKMDLREWRRNSIYGSDDRHSVATVCCTVTAVALSVATGGTYAGDGRAHRIHALLLVAMEGA